MFIRIYQVKKQTKSDEFKDLISQAPIHELTKFMIIIL